MNNLRTRQFSAVLGGMVLLLVATTPAYGDEPGYMKHKLSYQEPAMVWDEALPLGNGLLGALVWGEGHPLKISLDRTDLWDLRPVPEFHSEEYSYEKMREWVADGKIEDLRRVYEKPYNRAGPTKIPAGRIEIGLAKEIEFETCELSLENGIASVGFTGGAMARVWVDADRTAGVIEIRDSGPVEAKLVAPAFGGVEDAADKPAISAGELGRLGYKPPQTSESDNGAAFVQEGWEGFRFAVALEWKQDGAIWKAAWSIATSEEGADPLEIAQERARNALKEDTSTSADRQHRWWKDYWNQASVSVPNATIERQWYLETYKFGAATRPDTPPITLQGPWTADDGKLPPWKGDYHHDLNTELSYWPCYSGNRLDQGAGFVDWLWDTRENCVEWTKRFYDLPGMNVPMTADLKNLQIGGWHQYTHSLTTACWLSHHFYLQWRYTADRAFLRDRAYPYLKDSATFIARALEKGSDGKWTLPLSSSPEINDNKLNAWFPSITNYDLALIRWIFVASAELADELGIEGEGDRWRSFIPDLPELAVSEEDGRLLIAKDTPLESSHRHHSNLMAIHPLGLLRWENGAEDQRTIVAALEDLDRLGTKSWTGYSFSWQACFAARARDGNRAERALQIFAEAFCLRNSFHCNGDQSEKGYSNFSYRPFTLEGNFAFAAALQEMLLQSYSGKIHLFPAIPDSWEEASFQTLRAEGAFLVSAERREGKTAVVEIESLQGGPCVLADPFEGDVFHATGAELEDLVREDGLIRIETIPGQKFRLTRTD